jgi:hypothetical protein
MSPENTMNSPISQKRVEANRLGAQKGIRPPRREGESQPRLNGVASAICGDTPVLPGEDPAEFEAYLDAVVSGFAPQNQLEFELLSGIAESTWALRRCRRAETAEIGRNIRQHQFERDQRDAEEAVALGQRLLWSPRGPWQLHPNPHATFSQDSEYGRISWAQDPDDRDSPPVLVLRLERTAAGCRWLLDRWGELRARLAPGEVWTAPDRFKAIRLLGKQPLDAIDDPDVALIFLASYRVCPPSGNTGAFADIRSELSARSQEDDLYLSELRKRQLARMTPRDGEAARAALRSLIDRRTTRLKTILARHHEIAESDMADAADRLAFDPSPEADKRRRYALSAARLANETLNAFLRIRSGLRSGADSSAVRRPLSVDTEPAEPRSVMQTEHIESAGILSSEAKAHSSAAGGRCFVDIEPSRADSGSLTEPTEAEGILPAGAGASADLPSIIPSSPAGAQPHGANAILRTEPTLAPTVSRSEPTEAREVLQSEPTLAPTALCSEPIDLDARPAQPAYAGVPFPAAAADEPREGVAGAAATEHDPPSGAIAGSQFAPAYQVDLAAQEGPPTAAGGPVDRSSRQHQCKLTETLVSIRNDTSELAKACASVGKNLLRRPSDLHRLMSRLESTLKVPMNTDPSERVKTGRPKRDATATPARPRSTAAASRTQRIASDSPKAESFTQEPAAAADISPAPKSVSFNPEPSATANPTNAPKSVSFNPEPSATANIGPECETKPAKSKSLTRSYRRRRI